MEAVGCSTQRPPLVVGAPCRPEGGGTENFRKEPRHGQGHHLLARRDDMSREDFTRYTRDQHVPLVAKLPGLRRLVVNHVLPDPNGPPPVYDAVAEDWF